MMLTPQLVGRAENAHRPVLDRILAGTGTSRDQWVALMLTASAGGTVDRRTLAGHLTDALKVDAGTAEAAIAGLTGAGLLADDPDARVGLTGAGRAHHARIRSAVDDVVARVYGDIPAADLATAGRVLALVTERLNALR